MVFVLKIQHLPIVDNFFFWLSKFITGATSFIFGLSIGRSLNDGIHIGLFAWLIIFLSNIFVSLITGFFAWDAYINWRTKFLEEHKDGTGLREHSGNTGLSSQKISYPSEIIRKARESLRRTKSFQGTSK